MDRVEAGYFVDRCLVCFQDYRQAAGEVAVMAEQQDRPLWQVMWDAFSNSYDMNLSTPMGMAAELRAIADVVAPEEPHIPSDITAVVLRAQRQRIRALLLAEAERAERHVGQVGDDG
jgi:hypothetical protein